MHFWETKAQLWMKCFWRLCTSFLCDNFGKEKRQVAVSIAEQASMPVQEDGVQNVIHIK